MRQAIDKALVRRRFERSLATYDRHATVQREMAARLAELVRRYHPSGSVRRILELGSGTGLLTRRLVALAAVEELFAVDLVGPPRLETPDGAAPEGVAFRFIEGDMEAVALPGGIDLVATCAALQWVEDPSRLLQRLDDALRPGGWIACATFAPGNLAEIAELTGVSLEYLDREAVVELFDGRFEIVCWERFRRVLHFPTARDVLRHLRHTGVSGLRRTAWSRRQLEQFAAEYESRFHEPEGFPLTYVPQLVLARRCD